MYHGSLTPSKATEWKAISDSSIVDLAARGALPVQKLKEYMDQNRVSSSMVLSQIDFSDPVKGAQVLKKYYHALFLNG